MEITKQIAELQEELIRLRRDFHQHPELGLEEFRTSEKVAEYLKQCGLEVKQQIAKTGVIGVLRGEEPGQTLLLRADMDALPIREENDVPYKSVYDGKMHACAHDGHTAILLVAAKILSRYKNRLKGNIKFLFEPNEENVGALAMIEAGALENPSVDACLGLHLWAPIETGKLAITSGPVMAGMEHFTLTIKGRGGHTATPQTAVDPIITAANIVQTVQIIQTREIDVLKPTIIMFGKIQGGTASNVIADKVVLGGTMRYLYDGGENTPETPGTRFERIVANVCNAHRTEYELSFLYGHPTLINDHATVEIVKSVAKDIVETSDKIVSYISMAGEDFSEFAARVPSAYYFVGAGNPEKDARYPHHHPRFNIDEDALKIGVAMHVRTALKFFDIVTM
jgi:amidohydrolase